MLCTSALAFAQHDMKDMPGMNMDKSKTQHIKKPAVKNKQNTETQKVIYTCPMHPQVQKDKPGKCPICGMTSVKKTTQTSPSKPVPKKQADMDMPMNDTSKKMDMENMNMDKHDMKMDDMKGMDMSKKENSDQTQPTTYTCVMHPQIHSPKPGSCRICGMKLIKEKPKSDTNSTIAALIISLR